MKGIILAGGIGSRLYPITKSVSKQLLPIYDKPLIYYPLSVLMLASIRDILIISTAEDMPNYKKLLGDGSLLGINLSYISQEKPKGVADAFIIGAEFIGQDDVCLILGDNIFYGQDLTKIMKKAEFTNIGATIFGYPVKDASSFGVVEFDASMNALSIEEKPKHPKSNYAIPGIYFYDNHVIEVVKNISPSSRGELEISSINNYYLKRNKLNVLLMGRGMAWLDTGTPDGMLKAAEFVKTIQSRQGFYIACLEEIAWRRGFIDKGQLKKIGKSLKMTDYGQYILSLLNTDSI